MFGEGEDCELREKYWEYYWGRECWNGVCDTGL